MIVNRNLSSASPKISGRQVSMHLVFATPSELQPNLHPEPRRAFPSTVLLITRAPCTSKTLARGRYNYGKRLWRSKEKARGACASPLPFPRSGMRACMARLSATLPSLDALPLGSFREPALFDCTVIILHMRLHTESLCLYRVLH